MKRYNVISKGIPSEILLVEQPDGPFYRVTEVDARIAELEGALKDLIRGYVNTIENGRDRIIFLGGDCDPVDVMERGDPYLQEARKALGL